MRAIVQSDLKGHAKSYPMKIRVRFLVFAVLFILLATYFSILIYQSYTMSNYPKTIHTTTPVVPLVQHENQNEHINLDSNENSQSNTTIHAVSTENSPQVKVLPETDLRIHVFYYIWYGNPKFDGKFLHWNHKVLPHWTESVNRLYPQIDKPFNAEGDSIGANYFPMRGTYSSSSKEVICDHFKEMAKYKIGVVSVSWWGVTQSDANGANVEKFIPFIMDCAQSEGLKVNFHLEPYKDRTAISTASDVKHIIDTYGSHPAMYMYKGKPMFYIYDSYLIRDWEKVLAPTGISTIRGTEYDSYMISLYLGEESKQFVLDSHFDGIYTYFASVGFTQGSTPQNWLSLSDWTRNNKLIFCPSVGPGYDDTRIRPWNSNNKKWRNDGKYYQDMFDKAIQTKPDLISITSYNEWHEGTQIESAIPKTSEGYTYESYGTHEPDFYMDLTRKLIESWK
jgi:glycoprotein endo-alpha-1,2-mannosidase